jgi:hypothetical protein
MVEKSKSKAAAEPAFQEVAPIAGYDLAKRYPVWSPKDGVALKGLLLGRLSLPSAIEEQSEWACYAVKLTGPTMVHDAKDDGETTQAPPRVAQAGEMVLMTATAVLKRLEPAAHDERLVFEIYIKPGVEKNLGGGKKLQTFSSLVIGAPQQRGAGTILPAAPAMKALPAARPPTTVDEEGNVVPF